MVRIGALRPALHLLAVVVLVPAQLLARQKRGLGVTGRSRRAGALAISATHDHVLPVVRRHSAVDIGALHGEAPHILRLARGRFHCRENKCF